MNLPMVSLEGKMALIVDGRFHGRGKFAHLGAGCPHGSNSQREGFNG
jgi:hypothetical protein